MNDYSEFVLDSNISCPNEGSIVWESPSNIALIKYWGKKEHQIPSNPSISFTLNNCKTITKLSYKKLAIAKEGFDVEVFLDGEKKDDFKPKIITFFERVVAYVPFIKNYSFVIETKNTFPHSSGIASSASGMSALALCLMSIEKEINPAISTLAFNRKASFLARLGSGSASRSIEGPIMCWGRHSEIPNSEDFLAIKYPFKVHENFNNFQDTILLIDKGEKQVSSTVGHNLMHNHPFAVQRFDQAHKNMSQLKEILESGNLKQFIEIVESEALTLHAMMMTSMPYFILMRPNTLEVIQKIWAYRARTNSNICFTLDAGANVHILYPDNEKEQIMDFITSELVVYCQNEQYICDSAGFGAKNLNI